MDQERKFVVWPSYIDSSLKRREGRRINRKEAVDSPTLQQISEALMRLGIEHEADEKASYPSRWYRREGRIFVHASMKKIDALRRIAEEISRHSGGNQE